MKSVRDRLYTVRMEENETSVVSGKNMMRIMKSVGDRLYTVRMEENDVWFEEKTALLINLDTELQKLSVVTERLVVCRKKLSRNCLSLSRKLTVLGNTETNRNLATALASLAHLEENVGQIQGLQAKDDLFLVSELVYDYIGVIRSVKEVLGERVKAWHSWQTVLREVDKRKEAKRKAEVAGNQDRINTLRQEIAEIERQVSKEEGNFNKISR